MATAKAYMDSATVHIEDVTSYIEDATDHTLPVTAHTKSTNKPQFEHRATAYQKMEKSFFKQPFRKLGNFFWKPCKQFSEVG